MEFRQYDYFCLRYSAKASTGGCLLSKPLNGISEYFCKFASQIRLYISCVKNQIEWLSIVADSHMRRV